MPYGKLINIGRRNVPVPLFRTVGSAWGESRERPWEWGASLGKMKADNGGPIQPRTRQEPGFADPQEERMEERILKSDVKPMPRPQRKRRRSIRGSAMLEFTFTIMPFLAITTFLISMSWDYFTMANLQQAVRMGVRTGVTVTPCPAPTPVGGCPQNQVVAGSNLTALIKNTVKQNALVSLPNPNCQIQVHYYDPPDATWAPAPGTTNTPPALSLAIADVAAQTGDLVVVSIPNYSLNPLVPILFPSGYSSSGQGWAQSNTTVITYFSATSADLFEPCSACPTLGVYSARTAGQLASPITSSCSAANWP